MNTHTHKIAAATIATFAFFITTACGTTAPPAQDIGHNGPAPSNGTSNIESHHKPPPDWRS